MTKWITKVPSELTNEVMTQAQVISDDFHKTTGSVPTADAAEKLRDWIDQQDSHFAACVTDGLLLDALLVPIRIAAKIVRTHYVDYTGKPVGSNSRTVSIQRDKTFQLVLIDNIPISEWPDYRDSVFNRYEDVYLDRQRAEQIDEAVQQFGSQVTTVGEACQLAGLDLDQIVVNGP